MPAIYKDGTVFDSSRKEDPLAFTLDGGKIFPGFEKGIIGTTIGRSKTITLDAVEAYWQMSDDPAIDVEKKEIPYNINPSVGLNLHMRQHVGKVVNLVVSRVADETLTLDADYQLAGKNRIFDIELLEIA